MSHRDPGAAAETYLHSQEKEKSIIETEYSSPPQAAAGEVHRHRMGRVRARGCLGALDEAHDPLVTVDKRERVAARRHLRRNHA